MSYEHVQKCLIPQSIIDETLNIIRQVGRIGHEAFVFWAGTAVDTLTFQVTDLIYPKQRPQRNAFGAWVDIDGDELDRVNMDLYHRKLNMAIQVHSHPREAYHSQRDDEKAVVIFPGSLSMVIPDFGIHPFNGFEDWAVYRKAEKTGWIRQSEREIKELLVITEG